ncbi:hypothetical protein F2P81_017341 [Scophthalmus maximus]|uniref:Uncharacterized protein n=1 Tax=Scophthalmus maximus TaxID=52904 RepID=A0A6A4SFH3_SCOMX|nr:hypothetical protein F2P81_017341 [Scophthalmus maximus]
MLTDIQMDQHAGIWVQRIWFCPCICGVYDAIVYFCKEHLAPICDEPGFSPSLLLRPLVERVHLLANQKCLWRGRVPTDFKPVVSATRSIQYLGFANFTRVEGNTVVRSQGTAGLDDVLTAWYLVLLRDWGIKDELPVGV